MPQLPHAIELHDSNLETMRRDGDTLILELRPAYVHRDGAGWTQDADIHLSDAAEAAVPEDDLPSRIWDGTLETPHGVSNSLLRLPLDASGPVRLVCDLVTGARIAVGATAIRIVLRGEARFVEKMA